MFLLVVGAANERDRRPETKHLHKSNLHLRCLQEKYNNIIINRRCILYLENEGNTTSN